MIKMLMPSEEWIPDEQVERKLILVTGKGGAGKSSLSLAIDSHFRRLDIPFRAIDADLSNATFSRRSGQAKPLAAFDASEVVDRIQSSIHQDLIVDGFPYLIVDTGAGSERPIREWMDREKVVSLLKSERIATYVFTVVNPALDCVTPLLENAKMLSDAENIIAFNFGGQKGDTSRVFDALKELKEFQDASRGMQTIDIPHLEYYRKFDQLDMPLHEIDKWQKELNIFVTAHAKAWMSAMDRQLKVVLDENLPTAH